MTFYRTRTAMTQDEFDAAQTGAYTAWQSDLANIRKEAADRNYRLSLSEIAAEAGVTLEHGTRVRPNHQGEDISGNSIDYAVHTGTTVSSAYMSRNRWFVDVNWDTGVSLSIQYPLADLDPIVEPAPTRKTLKAVGPRGYM